MKSNDIKPTRSGPVTVVAKSEHKGVKTQGKTGTKIAEFKSLARQSTHPAADIRDPRLVTPIPSLDQALGFIFTIHHCVRSLGIYRITKKYR